MASPAAVAGLEEVPHRLVACLGFGVDAHHGVNHSLLLENLAALDRAGGSPGALSLPRDSAERAACLDTVAHAQRCHTGHPSVVHGSVAAAVRSAR
jgi:hypothetical protein